MTEDDACTALIGFLDPGSTGHLPAPYTAVPYTLQNAFFAPPRDPSTSIPTPWVYIEIEFSPAPNWATADSGLISIGSPGSNLYRKWGILSARVFVPVNDGDQQCRQIAASLSALFQGQDIITDSGAIAVQCTTTDVHPGGTDDDGNWWSRGAVVNFYFDQDS